MANFWDNIWRNISNTVGNQISNSVTGLSGDLLDLIFGGGAGGGLATSGEATNLSEEMLDYIRNFALQEVPADPVQASLIDAYLAQGIDPIEAMLMGELPGIEANTIGAGEIPNVLAMLTQDSPEMRNRQANARSQLETIANEGMTPADQAVLAAMRADQAQAAANSDQAVLQDMLRRGQAGGLNEVFMRQIGRQGAARDANRSAVSMASNIQDRQQQAVRDAGNLAGAIRGQDINLSTTRAEQQNQMNRFNAGNEMNRLFQNMDALNRIAIINQDNELRRRLANMDAENASRRFNAANELQVLLANQDAENAARRFNAQNQTNVNLQNRDALMQAVMAMNNDQLARLQNVITGYRSHIDQLNAEEAAAARREFANEVMGYLGGTGDVGGGTGSVWDDIWDSIGGGGSGGGSGDGGNSIWDDVFGLDPNGGGIWGSIDDIWDGIFGSDDGGWGPGVDTPGTGNNPITWDDGTITWNPDGQGVDYSQNPWGSSGGDSGSIWDDLGDGLGDIWDGVTDGLGDIWDGLFGTSAAGAQSGTYDPNQEGWGWEDMTNGGFAGTYDPNQEGWGWEDLLQNDAETTDLMGLFNGTSNRGQWI